MARTWLCRCGYRNDRVWVKCRGDNCNRTRPRARRPAHMAALDFDFDYYAELNETVHGVDQETCAICGLPGRTDIRLQRDHAHFGDGYPRGLAHALCNKILGEVERGRDAEQWLENALAYVVRAREHHEREEAA